MAETIARPGGDTLRNHGWLILLALAALAIAGHALLTDPIAHGIGYEAIGFFGVCAMLVGIHVNGPSDRRPWYLLTAGLASFVLGDALWDVMALGFGVSPFPSIADIAYLGGYPLLFAGLTLLAARRKGHDDQTTLLDAAIVGTSFAVLALVFIVEPTIAAGAEDFVSLGIALAYPVFDIFLLAILVRLALSPGRMAPAYLLLMAAIGFQLIGDLTFLYTQTQGQDYSSMLDPFWLGVYATGAATALHPTMRTLTLPHAGEVRWLSRPRLVLLTLATLVSPALIVYQEITQKEGFWWITIVGAVVSFVFVLVRMERVVHALHRSLAEQATLSVALEHRALHDVLTGLPNRALFQEWIEHALSSRDEGACVAILFIDVDDFKAVNDTRGHAIGDVLLRSIASQLSRSLRGGDTAARLGGDEFGVLLESAGSPEDALELGRRLLATLSDAIDLAGAPYWTKASIGIAVGRPGTISADVLLRHADIAMYEAKRQGKGRCELFVESMNAIVVDRLQLREDFAVALQEGQLRLHFQPIVELATDRLRGVEALVRWDHPRRGLLGPEVFIEIAEETGLIVPLGRWVIAEACSAARALQEASPQTSEVTMSANLSVRQLRDPELVSRVAEAIEAARIRPSSLVLEITETALLSDPESRATLADLDQLGVTLALDDFGTGYSSLSYLYRLPIEYLKIDRSFVNRVAVEPDQASLTSTIIGLAETLRLRSVAEGIERIEDLEALRRMGCQLGQGYLFAPPIPLDELLVFTRDAGPSSAGRFTPGGPLSAAGRLAARATENPAA